MLVLSLFHGLDLFGRGFEQEKFFVVRAAEKILGFDAADFHPPKGKFDGIIGGSPCQSFSLANRNRTHKNEVSCNCYGCKMLKEFCRIVTEAKPSWFVLENVSQVPDIAVDGYKIQRFNLNASECGMKQNRLRAFQFGSLSGLPLVVRRLPKIRETERCCIATEAQKDNRRTFADFCELQGLPRDFDLSHFSTRRKYELVGNAVPVPMARLVAKSIRDWTANQTAWNVTKKLCICGCGREIVTRRTLATDACKQRVKRNRDRATACAPGIGIQPR